MKFHKLLILAVLTAFMCVSGAAETFSVDGIYYSTLSGTPAAVAVVNPEPSSYSPYNGAVTVPATVNYQGTAYTVHEVGGNCFYGPGITSITLPDCINRIDRYGINQCSDLTSLTLPVGIDTLGTNAVFNCSKLTTITLPANLKVIRSQALMLLPITSLSIPKSVTLIEANAFERCSNLAALNIASGNSVYAMISNYLCSKDGARLIMSLPGDNRTELKIPSCVSSIGHKAFYSNSKLTVITIPDNIITIGEAAFCKCLGVKEIFIGDNVREIGSEAFAGTSNCVTMTLGDNVNIIGEQAFSSCGNQSTGEMELHIPASVRQIGKSAFSVGGFRVITMDDGLEVVDSSAFSYMPRLKSVTMNNTIHEIKAAAFRDNTALDSIRFSDYLTTIGNSAFLNCKALHSLTLPRHLSMIHNKAFLCSSGGALMKVYLDNRTPPAFDADGESKLDIFYGMLPMMGTLYVPNGCVDDYKAAEVWKTFRNIQESAKLSVGDTFSDNGLTLDIAGGELKVTVPENVEVKVYNASGMLVSTVQGSATIDSLQPGVYIVCAGNQTRKVVL